MKTASLDVRGLSKTYDNQIHALDGVNLSVEPGLYGLLGPNGAGKSTLMRTLATLQRPDAGSITLDGVDTLANPDHLRERLGYLPQQIGTYPGVSARRLLERFAWLKGYTDKSIRRVHVSQLLERVNLSEDADRAVATYSGGMMRRFGIAIAIIGSPRLLIVDEPTAGLDPAERKRFHNVLSDLGEDAVVLLSTHIVDDVENLCPRLSILNGGRIVAEGTPSDLTSQLAGKVWKRDAARGELLPEKMLHYDVTPAGRRVIIVSETRPHGFDPHAPRLEDAYHHALAS